MANNTNISSTEKIYDFNHKVCNLYLKDDMSNVKFVFLEKEEESGTGERKVIAEIPAHKFLLAAESEVFRTMFNGMWNEKNEVEINDSSPEAFKEFLQCVYLPNGTFTNENIHDVMNLANKYQITGCMSACVRFLIDNLAPADVCLGYSLAILHEQSILKQYCEERISMDATTVFGSDDFLNCDRKVLAEILKLDITCSATTVFDSCLAWAKKSCQNNGIDENNTENLRNQLGECLHLIRFGTMTLEEFTDCTQIYGEIFKANELLDIIHCISKKGNPEKFGQKPRLCWDENKIWRCFTRPFKRTTIQTIETVQLTSSNTTLLGGLCLSRILRMRNCFYSNAMTTIDIFKVNDQLKDSNLTKSLFSGKVNCETNNLNYTHVELYTPIVIEKDTLYEVRIHSSNCKYVLIDGSSCGRFTSPNGLQITFQNPHNGNYHLVSGLELLDL